MAMMGEEELPSQRLNIATLPFIAKISSIKTADLEGLKDIANRFGMRYDPGVEEESLRYRLLHKKLLSKDTREIFPELILDEINMANEDELRQLAQILRVDFNLMRNLDQMRHRLRQAIALDLSSPSRGVSVKDRTDPLRGNPSDNTPSSMQRLEQNLRYELEQMGSEIQARENRSKKDVEGFDKNEFSNVYLDSRAKRRGDKP